VFDQLEQLSSMPLVFLSLFKAPSLVIDKLICLKRKFYEVMGKGRSPLRGWGGRKYVVLKYMVD